MSVPFERIGARVEHEGVIGQVRVERYRHADGGEVDREVVGHPGAVAIVALDNEHVWLVRQPREIVGLITLEVPAGKLDAPGETSLQTAQRELAEEIGMGAAHWEPLTWFHTSPGFTDEKVEVFLATGLFEADGEPSENERIEIVRWPLAQLHRAVGECRDAKSLVALLMLAERMRG
jgi:8-oxo-dGTP pyrophosphatase MutT (NUDIX family)